MLDFLALSWRKQPIDGALAQSIRRDVRKHRRERGRAGHRFSQPYLKTLWGSIDNDHAVLNHVDDLAWQMWFRDPRIGWWMVSWHLTRREAQAAAENVRPAPLLEERAPDPGLYVLAGSSEDRLTIRTQCSSEYSAEQLEETYAGLGFITRRETIGQPVG